MSGPLPVARVPRPQMPAQYDPALLEAAFQAIERDLVRRFTREADLALEPGKRLVLAGEGGNTQYALGLDNDGGLTVTNYLTGAEGELIVDWAQVDGAAARDLQIAALEAVADGLADTYATVSALASVESSLEGSIASLSSGVSASFASTNASVSTNASAIATINGAAAFLRQEVAAAGGDPAIFSLSSGNGGSEISLASRIIRLMNSTGGTTIEVMRAIGGFAFFRNPISADFAGRRLTIGPGFGVSGQEVIFWFGPDTTAPSAQSRTNGYFAFGSNGVPYFGTAALGWGATAPEAAASNALVTGPDANRVALARFERGAIGWTEGFVSGSISAFNRNAANYEGTRYLTVSYTAGAAVSVFALRADSYFQVYAGERLACRCGIQNSGPVGLTNIEMAWYNSSGALISYTRVGQMIGANSTYANFYEAFVVAPAGAVQARYEIFLQSSGAAGSGYLTITQPQVSGAFAAQTIVPRFNSIRNAQDGADQTIETLPPNVSVSQAATFNPVYPLSSPSSTSISVAATTITLPGRTITTGSATISGLSAGTIYTVFYDVTNSTFVALSTGASSYFASLTRYVSFGSQSTQNGGGGYTEPPPPPPGGGGGWNGRGAEP